MIIRSFAALLLFIFHLASMPMQTVNKLILGDNLEILKQLDSESVDLVYLDPPFSLIAT